MHNLRQLHIIRGFAALYVAIGHAKIVFWSGGKEYIKTYPVEEWAVFDYIVFAIDMLSSSAQEFVIVFFILSGFFIAFSLPWLGHMPSRTLQISRPGALQKCCPAY